MAERKRKANTNEVTHVVTAGTTIRFEQPKSKRQQKQKVVVVTQDLNPVGGFVTFLREHSVVSLAVGFAIATQAQALIKQLITSFIDPMYALLLNGEKLSSKTFVLHFHDRTQQFGWGIFVYTLIDFLFVLLVIYLIIKVLALDKLDKPADKK